MSTQPLPSRSDARKPLLADNVYRNLKNAAMVAIPAFGTLYLAVATIWGLPGGEQVVATCVALSTFLGAFVKVSEISYDASDAVNTVGILRVANQDDVMTYQLDLGDTDPSVIDRSGKVVFHVEGPQ